MAADVANSVEFKFTSYTLSSMSRYHGPKCRLCRREANKLFLKGDRCETQKCALLRKNYAPGFHGKTSFAKKSEYARQLREKQKARRIFGISEAQFRRYYQKSTQSPEATGETLLKLLERRLDNAVYRATFASSRDQARQMISHGLLTFNKRRVNVPSIQLKVGDVFEVRDKNKNSPLFTKVLTQQKNFAPKWLKVDFKNLRGEVADLPQKEDLESNIQVQLIVEFYSK